MRVRARACVRACVRARACVCVCVRVSVHVCVSVSVRLRVRVCVCVRVRAHESVYVWVSCFCGGLTNGGLFSERWLGRAETRGGRRGAALTSSSCPRRGR